MKIGLHANKCKYNNWWKIKIYSFENLRVPFDTLETTKIILYDYTN